MPPIPEANRDSVNSLEAVLQKISETKVVVVVDNHTVVEIDAILKSIGSDYDIVDLKGVPGCSPSFGIKLFCGVS
uniref:Uncharacterized protein n=1 Tax=Trichuris muris TaxID=70415 RepID=A0A5S6R2V6_TRIMR